MILIIAKIKNMRYKQKLVAFIHFVPFAFGSPLIICTPVNSMDLIIFTAIAWSRA